MSLGLVDSAYLEQVTASLLAAQEAIDRNKATATACCALVFVDYALNIHKDYRHIWLAERSSLKVLFIFLRHFLLGYCVYALCAFYNAWTPEECKPAVHLLTFLPTVLLLCAHAILSLRLWAVWNKARWTLVLTSALMLVEGGLICYSAFRPAMITFFEETGPCLVNSDKLGDLLYYIPPMVVEVVLTALTLWKCLDLRKDIGNVSVSRAGRLVPLIFAQSLQYMLSLAGMGVMTVVLVVLRHGQPETQIAGTISVPVSVLLVLHLVLDLKGDVYMSMQVRQNSLGTGSTTLVSHQASKKTFGTSATQHPAEYELSAIKWYR